MSIGGIIAKRRSRNRTFFSLDKSNSFRALCAYIKLGKILFPNWESIEHLAQDILSLHEEPMKSNDDITYVDKDAGKTDDWADAVNMAVICGWYTTRGVPDISDVVR
jgi:hypothetical protein